jgi:ribonuclease G
MTEDILINITPQETRVALLEQGSVQELHIERANLRGLVGNVYLGKVVRVLPGMQSAFIDIGLDRAGFLHVADIWEYRAHQHAMLDANVQGTPMLIEKILFEGQTLLVQVIKDPLGTKGARLATQISIAGRMLVYLPQDPHIGISQRIEAESNREHLRERLQRLVPTEETGGYIVRTMAEEATDQEWLCDINYLRKQWNQIVSDSWKNPAPFLLYQDLTLAQRVLRDIVTEKTTTILADDPATFAELKSFAAAYMPSVEARLVQHQGNRPLFEHYGVESEIAKALGRRVDLKSGGYVIIDQTEAMTTVDVNTGGFVHGKNFDETIFKTNLEAAQTIARQLRLRNLGGIIIIDFIDMDHKEHQDAVLDELKKAMETDRTRSSISPFSGLGLVEMTRKRTRESLSHVLCEPCGVCQGRGQLKTVYTICYEILRELTREAQQFNAKEYRVIASVKVVDILQDEESQHVAELETQLGKRISLRAEASYGQEQYDIILV